MKDIMTVEGFLENLAKEVFEEELNENIINIRKAFGHINETTKFLVVNGNDLSYQLINIDELRKFAETEKVDVLEFLSVVDGKIIIVKADCHVSVFLAEYDDFINNKEKETEINDKKEEKNDKEEDKVLSLPIRRHEIHSSSPEIELSWVAQIKKIKGYENCIIVPHAMQDEDVMSISDNAKLVLIDIDGNVMFGTKKSVFENADNIRYIIGSKLSSNVIELFYKREEESDDKAILAPFEIVI